MPAIKPHKTPVDKTGSWDGPKAVADAPNEEKVLRYIHAWMNGKGDPNAKGTYKMPHHKPGTDTAAVIAGVNNVLSRLPQANIPAGDRAGVEAHARKHRKDAGLEEAMSESEIAEAVKHIKKMDDLNAEEAAALTEAIKLQEQANLGNWMEAQLHMRFTDMADSMFGDGYMTRDERIMFSNAIGDALNAFHDKVMADGPQCYQRRPFEGPSEDGAQPMAESGKPMEINIVEAANGIMPLMEKALRADGSVDLKIIQPGWGSSGYYLPEVLEKFGPKAFPKGTKMFWNHPTPTEEAERPERDLNDFASTLLTDAKYQANGPKGPGLYARAEVKDAYRQAVESLAKDIGVSIRAKGRAMQGSAEGQSGTIITEILPSKLNSVDYVTVPGAGGEIIAMFEAARKPLAVGGQQLTDADNPLRGTSKPFAGTVPARGATNVANSESKMEEDMDKELQEAVATLQTKNTELATQNARFSEALALRDAKDMVREALAGISLPDVTKARLMESLAKNPPMKDGMLDKEAFTASLKEAIKAEVKYLEQVAGVGQIRGLGESQSDGDGDDEEDEAKDEELEDAFEEAFDMKESTAKIAAKGRDR